MIAKKCITLIEVPIPKCLINADLYLERGLEAVGLLDKRGSVPFDGSGSDQTRKPMIILPSHSKVTEQAKLFIIKKKILFITRFHISPESYTDR